MQVMDDRDSGHGFKVGYDLVQLHALQNVLPRTATHLSAKNKSVYSDKQADSQGDDAEVQDHLGRPTTRPTWHMQGTVAWLKQVDEHRRHVHSGSAPVPKGRGPAERLGPLPWSVHQRLGASEWDDRCGVTSSRRLARKLPSSKKPVRE